MISKLLIGSEESTKTVAGTVPGPQTINYGNSAAGYYGQLASTEIVDGVTLASHINLTAGDNINSTVDWFKFSYDSKTLFIPMKPFKSLISWSHIYQAGAVYGDDTFGRYQSAGNRIQDSRITCYGNEFRVRLMKIAPTDPAASAGREFTNLFYKLFNGQWASFAPDDLGANASSNWCWGMETYNSVPANKLLYHNNTSLKQIAATGVSNSSTRLSWRPVLELITT